MFSKSNTDKKHGWKIKKSVLSFMFFKTFWLILSIESKTEWPLEIDKTRYLGNFKIIMITQSELIPKVKTIIIFQFIFLIESIIIKPKLIFEMDFLKIYRL